MPQNTNLNISPYFDDFDDNKNYQKVLFKPGTPIQARELTTLQSILQNQIEKFGQHFFKEGAMVIPGQIAYDPNYTYVQINQSHLGIPISTYIENFVGRLIKGQTSGVIAKVEKILTNVESENSNYTLYVKYVSSSNSNFTTSTFNDGENLISLENIVYVGSSIRENSTFATSISTNSTGVGSAVKIAEGVYFIRGYFIKVNSDTIILDQYSNLPSYRVGLVISEELAVASDQYNDLYDNARGFSNFAAPGADRLVINTSFVKKDINDFNDENFIELLRVRNGEIEKFVNNTEYSLIRDELARRTYDESGDYYIKPFKLSLKESLNDKVGNNGVFSKNEITRQGNIPSDNLTCLSISPGKAYVRGFEIETNNILLDIEKPRTTESISNENLQFNFGNQIVVNNVYGSIPLGFTITSQVLLYDERNSNPGSSNGNLIGSSKVYDFQAQSSGYSGPQTEYVISLYDTQLFTRIRLNAGFGSLEVPTLIEGKNSGARGFLYSPVVDDDELLLYDVSGSFNLNEPLRIDGVDNNRLIVEIKDYNIGDVNQIVANETSPGIGTFTSDTVLSKKTTISDSGATFTISSEAGGESTVTSTSDTYFNSIEVGDVISYAKPGDILPTYNKIIALNQNNSTFTVSSLTSISGVCIGGLPSTQVVTTDLKKVEPTIINPTTNFYLPLNKKNIAHVDLSTTSISVKKSYVDVVGSSSYTKVLTDSELSFEIFDEENYTLSYVNTGNVVLLKEYQNISFSTNRKEVTITGLIETGPIIFTALCKINSITTRKKFYNRCSSIIINKSNNQSSGIGATTLNDGLTFNKAYGTRVQDREISLNVPDVVKVLAVYESSTTNNPVAPKISLSNISSSLLNGVRGEKIIGSTSNAVGYLIGYLNSTDVEYVSANENEFLLGESVTFEESGITATVTSIVAGDKNIVDTYDLDSGYREQYLDYSKIVRKNNLSVPNKKLRVIYNGYYILSNDSGDIVTISSYDSDRYSKDLPKTSGIYSSDFLDLRPSVGSYSGIYSPFESKSRVFSQASSSSPHIVSKNSTVNISYSYYLPRIDKVFLFKDGKFIINKGVPSESPAIPSSLDNALEVATIYLPAYLRNVSDSRIEFTQHKRYTMKDISRLEDRISNVEQYTLLSLLETDTKNLVIRDETTGLDRFKSGFFVDNFRNANSSDITNPDYRASLDINNGILRPIHYTTALDLIPGSNTILGVGNTTAQTLDLRYSLDLGSNNVKRIGDVICLNYDEVEYVKNTFATRTENINPFNVINWIGSLELNPSSDDWVETRRLEDRVVGTLEGDYLDAVRRLNVDTNTGLSPIEWGSWETIWTGSSTSGSWWATTTTTTTQQQRRGTQNIVSERFDNISLGDRVVSTSTVKFMRSRNIEIIGRRLKPNTRFYAFFDDVDVTEYIIPKLIEITMTSGTFIEGEVVTGVLGSKQIRFRLAKQNHKYGPVGSTPITELPENYPIEVYKTNPYSPDSTLPSIYSATSSVLNVDTASLEINGVSEFFGCIAKGMVLVGSQSRATATVSEQRLISDDYGTFIGSFFIPDPTIPSTPTFETGTKTLSLTTSETNSTIFGLSDSSGIANFTSSGLLETAESTTLRIRNADIETIEVQDERTITNTTTVWRNIDPLAQSFLVEDVNGVYVTKCDIFFRTKDKSNIPVTLQIRTVQLGLPTQTILPFGEVTINPDLVNVSEDGTVSTTFYFPSPVYLENGNQYAVVLLSASNEYNVWISRMGETEVTTLDLPESDRIIVSQQPLLGSLFKSQNGSTWDPSQYEDLKFTLYRAEFTSNSGTVRFYNPDLSIGNNQVVSLSNNPIIAYSKSALVDISKNLTTGDISLLTPGATITQENNNSFSANLVSVVGAIGIGSTLIVTNSGVGFGTTNTTTYSNVKLTSFTGIGKDATANISVVSGIAKTVTITNGGSGYIQGDVLSIDVNDTNNLGSDLILSVPNVSGVITAFNSILLDNIQGNLILDLTSDIVSNGTTLTSAPVTKEPTVLTDGLHFKVNHSNHGMYSYQNFVSLSGIEPDVAPVKLTTRVAYTDTEIFVNSVGILTTFENLPVNVNNPGYILINNEIIKYINCDIGTNSISGITRYNVDTIDSDDPLYTICYYPQIHSVGDNVFKYEFNGISLMRINTTHNLNSVNSSKYPISLDGYHIKVDMNSNNTNKERIITNPLFFNTSKFGGTYTAKTNQTNTVKGPKASQNILMTSLRPNIQTLLPKTTNITARIRTVSGTSVSGNETSFIDKGFEGISLNSTTIFEEPRMICSKVNEIEYLDTLPGKKSFTMELSLSTNDTKVSPMIDLDRVNVIGTMNRIDKPVENYKLDERVNVLYNDPHASVYVSKLVKLEKSADSLKVLFDAYRDYSNDIRVAYRIIRENIPLEQQAYELFPGYLNLDNNNNVIDQSNNDGTSDRLILPSNNNDEYRSYEFTAKNLPEFSGFQIKIMMNGINQAKVPLIKDLRAIATV